MNKKILLGSIIAVVILVLVSFTGVVGYQTTKSSTIARASPLFSVRSKRAIDRDSNDLTSDYVGKGKETDIHLSGRIQRAEQTQKAISIISGMSDSAFSKFVARIILNLKYQEKTASKETSVELQVLYYMREKPNVMKYYDKNNIPIDETVEYLSCRWFPGCYIIFYILADIVGAIMNWLFDLTLFVPCPSMWY